MCLLARRLQSGQAKVCSALSKILQSGEFDAPKMMRQKRLFLPGIDGSTSVQVLPRVQALPQAQGKDEPLVNAGGGLPSPSLL